MMRCPNCSAPVPEGNSRCFDCGTLVGEERRDPWEVKPTSRVRKNTSEKRYRQENLRQQLHEQLHNSHSTSKGAEGDYHPGSAVHKHAAGGKKPGGAVENPLKQKAKKNPRSADVGEPGKMSRKEKKKIGAIIALAVIILGIVGDHISNNTNDVTIHYEDTQKDAWIREENSNGSYIERYYGSDGEVESEWYYDADDNLQQDVYYYDDGTWDVEYFDEYGNMTEAIYYDSDGSEIAHHCYTYDDAGNQVGVNSFDSDGKLIWSTVAQFDDQGNRICEFAYDEEGRLQFEVYYDSDWNIIGERDYYDGEVTQVWGVDNDGNPLE